MQETKDKKTSKWMAIEGVLLTMTFVKEDGVTSMHIDHVPNY